ncbi:MAG: prephenate dehydrogenase/arogenate dehydrogenase family protein, partial [Actinomycetota bacterium]
SGSVHRVIGFDADRGALRRAASRVAITEAASTPADLVAEATIVVLATPVGAIPDAYRLIAPHLKPGTIVTDLGSAKARMVAEIGPLVPPGTSFIGGHPLAGAETEGIDSAEPGLYRGAFWILTPTEATDPGAYGRLVRFLGTLGVHVLSLQPARHDELVALTSHLPQLLSSALMGFAADLSSAEGGLPLIAAGGFRDMTRVAASSTELWLGIIRENRPAVLAVLERFQEALGDMAGAIGSQDWDRLRSLLDAAREGRDRLPERPGLVPAAPVTLLVPVEDRTGVLAEVVIPPTEAGVSIAGVAIVDAPEGGRGWVRLVINGEEPARRAFEALELRGFSPVLAPPPGASA